jgi:hypothetical protein
MGTPATGLTADLVSDTQGLIRLRWTGDADGLYNVSRDGRLVTRVRGLAATVAVGLGKRCTLEVTAADEDDDLDAEISSEVPPVSASIEWHVHSSTSADRFRVYWDEGDGAGADVLLEEVEYAGRWTLSIETPPLTSGVTYEFLITALDEAGNESSGTTILLTLRTLPTPPDDLAIAFNGATGRASLSWT